MTREDDLVCRGGVNFQRNIDVGVLAVFREPIDSVFQGFIACEPEALFGTHFGKAHLRKLRHEFLVDQLRHTLLGAGLGGRCGNPCSTFQYYD